MEKKPPWVAGLILLLLICRINCQVLTKNSSQILGGGISPVVALNSNSEVLWVSTNLTKRFNYTSNSWKEAINYSSRSALVTSAIARNILAIAFANSTLVTYDLLFNNATTFNLWSVSNRQYTAVTSPDQNRIFFAGGNTRFTVKYFDRLQNRILPTFANSIFLSSTRMDPGACSVGNFVLFAGGSSSGTNVLNTVDIYTLDLQSRPPTTLSASRKFPVSIAVGNYCIFAGGMALNSIPVSNIDLWNSATQTMQTTSPLSQPRYFSAACLLSGTSLLLIAGGKGSSSTVLNTVEVLNITSLSASFGPSLTSPMYSLGGASVSNACLFGSGLNSTDRITAFMDIYTLGKFYLFQTEHS